jgi:hypothetical protein
MLKFRNDTLPPTSISKRFPATPFIKLQDNNRRRARGRQLWPPLHRSPHELPLEYVANARLTVIGHMTGDPSFRRRSNQPGEILPDWVNDDEIRGLIAPN